MKNIDKKFKKSLMLVILLIIFISFLYYIVTHSSDFQKLELVNPSYIIYLVLISIILLFSNGLVLQIVLKPFGISLSFNEGFGLSMITSFYNTITPFRGGAVVRAAYLKKKHKFSYSNFVATLSGMYVLNFLAASILGFITLWFIYQKYSLFNPLVFLVILLFFIFSLSILIFSPKLQERNNPFFNIFVRIVNGWHIMRRNKDCVFKILLIVFCQLGIAVIGNMIIYATFGIHIGLVKAMFLVSIGYLATIIAVTPNSFGISEAVQVFSALLVNIPPYQSIAVAILGRILTLPVLFIFGPLYSYILLRKSYKK